MIGSAKNAIVAEAQMQYSSLSWWSARKLVCYHTHAWHAFLCIYLSVISLAEYVLSLVKTVWSVMNQNINNDAHESVARS